MKECLTWHNRPYRRTHSLEEAGAEGLTIDFWLQPLVDRAARLSDYAWRYRYPGSPIGPSLPEAQNAFVIARDVCDGMLARVPPEAHPPATCSQ